LVNVCMCVTTGINQLPGSVFEYTYYIMPNQKRKSQMSFHPKLESVSGLHGAVFVELWDIALGRRNGV
ncbi:MAG TPA: hypothetical protein PLD43_08510, partial [Anaerolineae bacterium]|nr:hypothetical protein [Anaerolineae bacterium]